MSKKLSILMLLMALIVPWAANAQQTVTIGTGTSGKVTHPVHMYYSYSLTQQIYTADEIGIAGNITSIAFNYAYSGSFSMNGFQMYMKQVDKSVFASQTDIVPLTDATKVYEGTFSANGAGWITLQLDTPFPYDGESNLLVCCFDPDSGKFGSSYKFNTTTTTGNASIEYYSNSIAPDVDNLSSYSGTIGLNKYRNNIQLVITPDACQKPSTLEVNGSTLTWTGGSGTYNVEYKKASDNTWTTAFTNLAAYTCPLTLDPVTDYEARVQSVCSGNETSYWRTISFTTPCFGITSFPWTENFDSYEYTGSNSITAPSTYPNDPLPDCWQFLNRSTSTSTYPQAYLCNSTTYAVAGNCLFFKSSSETPLYAVLPEFGNDISGLALSFTYRNEGVSTYNGTLYVSYMTDPTDASTFNEANSVACEQTTAKTTKEVKFVNAPAGSYFAFKYQGGSNNNYYLAIDNVSVRVPLNITATHIVNNVTNPSTQMTWAQFAQYVSEGESFEGKTITLDENITVTAMVGTEASPFCGTFDGNNKTITANITSDEKAAAPFRYISGATIHDLTVTGSVTCTGYHGGGLVGYTSSGTNTIENCLVSTTLTIKTLGGGIIGHGKSANNYLTGCVFNGSIINATYSNPDGNNANNLGVGGLVGWCDGSAQIHITNCLFGGQYTDNTTQNVYFHPVACKTGGASISATINNCYYTCDQEQADSDGNSNVATTAGRKAYSVTAISPVTMTNSVTGTVYNVSGITGYGTTWGGILYNGILYGGQGKTLSINLQGSPTGLYQTNYGTLSGTTNPFTLNMADNNTEISALTCVAPTGLAVSNVSAHAATVTWTRVATQETGPVTFEYVCVAHGATPDWTNAASIIDNVNNPNPPTAQPSGLTTETQYDFYVRRNCGGGDYSLAVMTSFTTTIACPAPTNLTLSNITGHTVTASWTGSSDSYNVNYRLAPGINAILEEHFTDLTSGIPAGWDNSEGTTTSDSYKWNYYSSGHEGAGVRFNSYYNSTGYTNFLKTPAMNFPAGKTMKLTFWWKNPAGGDFSVYISTNGGSTKTAIATGLTGQSDWKQETITLTNYISTGASNVTIHFKGTSNYGYGDAYIYLDDVVIGYEVSAGEWQTVTTDTTTVTLYGLTPETLYEVTVQSNCGDEGLSSETDPSPFTTGVACTPPSNLHTTDVTAHEAVLHWDGYAESYNVSYYKTFFFDDFEEDLSQWTIYKEGDDASWEWGIENPHDNSADLNAHSGYYSAVAYSDYDVHADSWLVTPQILFPNQTTLKFWIMRSTYDDAKDEYEVRLSTTGNAITDFTTVLKEKAAANSYWTEVSIDLSEYDGQQGYIAIRHDFTDGFFIMVDDFGIFGWSEDIVTTDNSLLIEDLVPETEYQWRVMANCGDVDGMSQWSSIDHFTTLRTCPVPIGLNSSDETAHGATLDWTGLSDSYQVMVGELEGNTISNDFENQTIPSTWTNNSTYPWTVVSGGQNGSYCIKSGNAGQHSTTSSISFTMNLTSDGTIDFDAECKGEGTSTYWDHCDFYIDSNRKLYAGANLTNSGWIHYSFDVTAGEHTFTWSYTKDSSTHPTGDYFAVDNIVVGSTEVASWTTYTATEVPFVLDDAQHIQPETSYMVKVKGFCDDEETDYCEPIIFTTTVTCLPIDSLSYTNLTPTSVNLNWVLLDETQAAWQICLNGNENNLIAANTNEGFLLGGLEPETEYTVKVRAFCDENDQSRWSNTLAFTTPISCWPVDSLSYDNLTSFSVNLSWVLEDETQTAWQICLNDVESNLIAANTNEGFLMDGLTPNVEYTVKVRAYCGENDYSRWSNTVTFTTPEVCATPTELAATNITAVSADLSWIGREDVESYTIRYRSTAGTVPHYLEDFNDNIDYWTLEDCVAGTGIRNGAFAFNRVTAADNPTPHQYLISPDLTSFITSNSVLEFKYRAYASSYAETFLVGFSSTNNEVDSFSWSDPISVSATTYQTYHADLPAGTKYIAIQCTSYKKYYLFIDDIVIGNEASAGPWMVETTPETESQLVNLDGGRTYIVQVRSDCNPDGWCDEITFNTELDGTKVFVTEGDWNTASNWIPQGTPAIGNKVILRADATVPSGCVAEANRILFEGTTLTIESGGQLKVNSNITATMKKNIVGYGANNAQTNDGFNLIAMPATTAITTANAGLITAQSDYDLYSWNRTATDEEWHYSHNGLSMENGKGYLYANQSDVEMNITATMQRSSLPVTMTADYDEQLGGGWSLCGNPFPCEVYLSTNAEGMAFYRLVGNTFVPITGAVAPMEGFFVKATAAGQTFTISREAPAK